MSVLLVDKSEGELAASRKDNAASPQQQTGHGETKVYTLQLIPIIL